MAEEPSGTLIPISHDRDFLDPIVDKIIHIEQQSMFESTPVTTVRLKYSAPPVWRSNKRCTKASSERVAHLQSYIDRFRAKATKAKQDQSRIKMLERMERLPRRTSTTRSAS